MSEYFAMVDFIKPNLLGTFKEFQNRFVNPIQNGQHSDSTARDVEIMKKRSFILSDLLKGCMQRRDYNVLVPYLQVCSVKYTGMVVDKVTHFRLQNLTCCNFIELVSATGEANGDH